MGTARQLFPQATRSAAWAKNRSGTGDGRRRSGRCATSAAGSDTFKQTRARVDLLQVDIDQQPRPPLRRPDRASTSSGVGREPRPPRPRNRPRPPPGSGVAIGPNRRPPKSNRKIREGHAVGVVLVAGVHVHGIQHLKPTLPTRLPENVAQGARRRGPYADAARPRPGRLRVLLNLA